jgi:hypothetical protein
MDTIGLDLEIGIFTNLLSEVIKNKNTNTFTSNTLKKCYYNLRSKYYTDMILLYINNINDNDNDHEQIIECIYDLESSLQL